MKASLFSYVISAALSFATIATASKPVENDTISSKKTEISERNVMLNASDANKPREIQIGLPSEDVNVYENGLPAVYSSTVHKLATHWRSDASLGEVGLMTPSESAIATGNIALFRKSFSKLGAKGVQRSLELPHQPFWVAKYRHECVRWHRKPLALYSQHLSELRSG